MGSNGPPLAVGPDGVAFEQAGAGARPASVPAPTADQRPSSPERPSSKDGKQKGLQGMGQGEEGRAESVSPNARQQPRPGTSERTETGAPADRAAVERLRQVIERIQTDQERRQATPGSRAGVGRWRDW